MKERYLSCGKIVGVHGVRGAVKTEVWCDTPSVLAHFDRVYLKKDGVYTPHAVKGAFVSGNGVVLTLDGINDRETALALRGTVLYAEREQIPVPEGAMLQQDMLGLKVIDAESGRVYGTLKRIDPSPASDLLVVDAPEGEVLVPMIPPFVKTLSDEGIFLTPPAGMFKEETV